MMAGGLIALAVSHVRLVRRHQESRRLVGALEADLGTAEAHITRNTDSLTNLGKVVRETRESYALYFRPPVPPNVPDTDPFIEERGGKHSALRSVAFRPAALPPLPYGPRQDQS